MIEDLNKLLKTFDATDEKYLNKIIKHLKLQAQRFKVENFIKMTELKLNKSQFDVENTNYYEKKTAMKIKNDINELLETPLKA